MTDHPTVSHAEWLDARKKLLAKEKELTRLREELAQARRDLPWERVEKAYTFEGPRGKASLGDLFAGRSQLVVYHFMFGPDWKAGCPHCSFWADSFDRVIVHLNQRDVTMVAVSRAPYGKLAEYEKRMGWSFDWYSSGETTYSLDFGASFTPEEMAAKRAEYNYTTQDPGRSEREGASVFYRDTDGAIFHTYSTYARGIDMMNTAYQYLDLVPKGRDEGGRAQYWVKRRDEYGK